MVQFDLLEQCDPSLFDRFRNAKPFGHLIVDGVLDAEEAAYLSASVPSIEQMIIWSGAAPGPAGEVKDRALLPEPLDQLLADMQSERFRTWLSSATGKVKLHVDPEQAWGALRRSGDGVEGSAHAGPTRHPVHPWSRDLTAVVYLSPGWEAANGGVLYLEPFDAAAERATIEPRFNRLAVFENGEQFRHSQSRTSFPDGASRMTLAAWYFREFSGGGATRQVSRWPSE